MKTSISENGNGLPRRRFFKSMVQALIAVGLTGSAGYLLVKEKREDECSLEFTCTLCEKTEQCGLPAANSFREYERSKQEKNRVERKENMKVGQE